MDMKKEARRVRSDLLRVFQYYTTRTIGGMSSRSITQLTSRQFMQLCKDAKLLEGPGHISVADIDVIYAEKTAKHPLEFLIFLNCIQVIGKKINKRADILITENILKNCKSRQSSALEAGVLDDPELAEMLQRYDVSLNQLFSYYSLVESAGKEDDFHRVEHADQSMSFTEFYRMMQEFDVAPRVVGQGQMVEIFRSANEGETSDEYAEELSYAEFQEAMVLTAMKAFPDPEVPNGQKVEKLLNSMFSSSHFREVRQLFGDRNPASLATAVQAQVLQYVRSHAEERNAEAKRQKEENAAKSDEIAAHELLDSHDEELRSIFQFYTACASTGLTNIHRLGLRQFISFAKDAQLITYDTLKLTEAQVELLFSETGKMPSLAYRMPFNDWKEVLKKIAALRYPKEGSLEKSVEMMLENNILKFSKSRKRADELREAVEDTEVKALLAEFRGGLEKIFTYYANREQGDVDFEEALRQDETMEYEEFLQFSYAFDITPGLLSRKELIEVFRAANEGLVSDDDDTTMDYGEFEECLIRCAVIAGKKKPLLLGGKSQSYGEMLENFVKTLLTTNKLSGKHGKYVSERDSAVLIRGLAESNKTYFGKNRQRKSDNDEAALKERNEDKLFLDIMELEETEAASPVAASSPMVRPESQKKLSSTPRSGRKAPSTPKEEAKKVILTSVRELVELRSLCNDARAGVVRGFEEIRKTVEEREKRLLAEINDIETQVSSYYELSIPQFPEDAEVEGNEEWYSPSPKVYESKLSPVHLTPPGQHVHEEATSEKKEAVSEEKVDYFARRVLPNMDEVLRTISRLMIDKETYRGFNIASPKVMKQIWSRRREAMSPSDDSNIYDRLYKDSFQRKKLREQQRKNKPRQFSTYTVD